MIIYYIFRDKNDYLHKKDLYNNIISLAHQNTFKPPFHHAIQNTFKTPFHHAILRALHRNLCSRAIFLVFESTSTFHTRNS